MAFTTIHTPGGSTMNQQSLISMLLVVCLSSCLAGNVASAQQQADQEAPPIVGAGANLVLTSISGPAEAFYKQSVGVTFQVENQGDEDSLGYQVVVYLSQGTTYNPDTDRQLKKISFDGLPAGETKKATRKMQLVSKSGEPGLYYYLGVLESSSISSSPNQVLLKRYQAGSPNGTVIDHRTGLMWQQTDDNVLRIWSEAVAYCNDLDLGGYDDWALPEIEKLQRLVDYSTCEPAINPLFLDCKPDRYWSTTANTCTPDYAWRVHFRYGRSGSNSKEDHQHYVRCVRNYTADAE
jgi:hypothetical protein